MEEFLSYKDAVEEIKRLNDTKQYTLIATGLLESLITEPNLTASAAKLWEYLYTKAIMNKDLSIKIRYKDLADKFRRSERTMKRQVENLKENGYLHVKSNFHAHGQRANTFYLKIPQTIFEKLKDTKDRKRSKKTDYQTDLTTHVEAEVLPAIQEIPLDEIKAPTKNQSLVEGDELNAHCLQDKNVTLNHDTNGMANNTINKEILINNNTNQNVVVYVQQVLEEVSIPALEEKNTVLEDKNTVLRETFDNEKNMTEQQQISVIESEVNLLFIEMGKKTGVEKISVFDKIKNLQSKISSITVMMNQRKQLNQIKNNTDFSCINLSIDFSKLPGERLLSDSEMTRISKSVEKMVPSVEDQKRICNEIIYSVRLGALRIAQNGDALSTSHAISIALKLLREKRWETPALMRQKENPTYYPINPTYTNSCKEKSSYQNCLSNGALKKLGKQAHVHFELTRSI